MINLLLLSSSRVGNTSYLEHAKNFIQNYLGQNVKRILFIPYAGVTISCDEYETMVQNAFVEFGYQIDSIHHSNNLKQQIENAEAIAVGGGNTFNLLHNLYEKDLLNSIKDKIISGTPYIGWSAGSNICGPTIRTTNDMPIIEPASFTALNLLPSQINPHYIEGNPPGHNGETREQHINEFLIINPHSTVIAIPEGTALQRKGNQLSFLGDKSGYIFNSSEGKQRISPNTDLSYLL